MENPLSALRLEQPFYQLGADYFDEVQPLPSSQLRLRWRNPELFERLGVSVAELRDAQLLDAFGHFKPLPNALHGPLAQRYIGFQFRNFNPQLGDGRGFLWAQARALDGTLLDLGTKGSGTTPYSRGGDGRLTLKGGVREIIAAEFLHALGVKTSRALTLIEHEAKLWRGDEPSPTRASILVRVGEAHIRFGTFERYFYLERDPAQREARLRRLLEHVLSTYYPHLVGLPLAEATLAFYGELMQRVAIMTAGWVKAGFAHGVLNTDNMNITGDSFDYGPWAFMEGYDPEFTAAYFDQTGLYAFEAQADAVYWNLAMLARPLGVLTAAEALEERLQSFPELYREALRRVLLLRLGFEARGTAACRTLAKRTLELLRASGASYHGFFWAVREASGRAVSARVAGGRARLTLPASLFERAPQPVEAEKQLFLDAWEARLLEEEQHLAPSVGERSAAELLAEGVHLRVCAHNPRLAPYRSEVEKVWAPIVERDDWSPLYHWLEILRHPCEAR